MPRIDGLLQALEQAKAHALVMVSGQPVSLQFTTGLKPLNGVPASSADIRRLLDEVLPADAKEELDVHGLARFPYRTSKGISVELQIELSESLVAVRATLQQAVASKPVASPPRPRATTPEGDFESPGDSARDRPLNIVDGTASDFEMPDDGPPLELDDRRDMFGLSGGEASAQSFGGADLESPVDQEPAHPETAPAVPSDWNDMFAALPGTEGDVFAANGRLPAPEPVPAGPGDRAFGNTSEIANAPRAPERRRAGDTPGLRKKLEALVARGGSDLHLAAGSPGRMRVFGELQLLDGPPLSHEDAESFLEAALPEALRRKFEERMSVDFAYAIPNVGRFRSNACRTYRGIHLTFRAVPANIPTPTQLGLPASVASLTQYPNGLILITGPAGCGKSTTQASLIDQINSTTKEHIITVEDPIEFIHPRKKCLVSQREVGRHAKSFAEALRSALREDPDVILVGELRDLQTIQLAITAAETGHLVLGTLHTVDAAKTVDRIIDVFPGRQKLQIRSMVSESLRGVVSQRLVRTADGKGRIAVYEVLLADRSVSNLLRDGKTFQIPNAIRLGRSRGMCTMDDSLAEMARSGRITAQVAMANASNPEDLKKLLQQPNRPSQATAAAPAAKE